MKTKRLLALLLSLCLLFAALPIAAHASGEDPIPEAKNVIMMIGDGMGENHLLLAREQGYDLFMDKNEDLRGQSKTRSSSSRVTDSAAGATALACGVRTTNDMLGVYFFDPLGAFVRPRSLTEAAQSRGMKTGIVTSDSTAGATPAGFSSHVEARGRSDKISAQQLDSGIDLIWGAACGDVDPAVAAEKGWTYITTASEMEALEPGSRSFGQFSGDTWRVPMPAEDPSPDLADMTAKAISLLDADTGHGFFLMVEGAHIDKNSHRSNDDGDVDFPEKIRDAANAVKGFDDAIRVAVEFARRDGETIVLVTADHETGDLYYDNGRYTYHSGSHTGKNVPVLVYGCCDLFAPGEAVENRDIPVLLARKLGWTQQEFRKMDPGIVPLFFRRLGL